MSGFDLGRGDLSSLQRQVAGEVQTQPQDRAVNQIAMMLAIMGLSLSYYSAKQMTEKVHVQPAPWDPAALAAEMMDESMTNGGCGAKRQRREGSSVSQDSTFSPQSLSDTDYLAPFVHLEQSFKGSQKCIFHTFCSQDLFFFFK